MRLLVDTDILSLLRRPERFPKLAAWRETVDETILYVSVVTFGEIERGIAKQSGTNAAFAAGLRGWAETVAAAFGPRVLPFGLIEARVWGGLSAQIGNNSPDLMIASTALANGATVVTRNVAHFRATGVEIINPF